MIRTGRLVLVASILLCMGCDDNFNPNYDLGDTASDPVEEVPEGATILAIGDSIMFWNSWSETGIPDVVAAELGEISHNAAVAGAVFLGGAGTDNIPNQYVDGDWEWLIVDGGGNDLNDECGCGDCADVMDEIISETGDSGVLPDLVNGVVSKGIRVILLGYYNVPETAQFGFAECNGQLDAYRERLTRFVEGNGDVWFVDPSEVVDPTDLDFYFSDHVHPSEQGSKVIGELIARQIEDATL